MSKLDIVMATVRDIDACLPSARKFHDIYASSTVFSEMAWRCFWTPVIERGGGVMLLLKTEQGDVVGGIGGLLTRYQTSMDLHLVEMFWWVDEEHRGRNALRLIREFENWGADQGADDILMTYMESSEPEKMKKLYSALGYEPFESHMVKSLEVSNA